jgi:hypothetical protein
VLQEVTPLWPRANEDVKNFMKNLGKVLKAAEIADTTSDTALQSYLKAYRDTPRMSTGVPPAVLMMGWIRSNGIPKAKTRMDVTSKIKK